MKYFAALLAILIAMTSAAAEATVDQKRKLYALGEAGPEYCPNIEVGWFKLGAIGYDMSADDYQLYKAAKNEWFQTFRKVGSQPVACQLLMDQFGPGTASELFQYK